MLYCLFLQNIFIDIPGAIFLNVLWKHKYKYKTSNCEIDFVVLRYCTIASKNLARYVVQISQI